MPCGQGGQNIKARPGFLPPGAPGCSVVSSPPNPVVFLLLTTVCLASCLSLDQKTMNSLSGPLAGNVIIDWSQLPAGLSLIFRPLSYTEIKLTIQLGEFHGGYLLIAPWLTLYHDICAATLHCMSSCLIFFFFFLCLNLHTSTKAIKTIKPNLTKPNQP